VPEAMAKYNTTGKLNAHFAVDNSGILYMEKAEYQAGGVSRSSTRPTLNILLLLCVHV
jgi:hypothetical protein